MLGGVKGVGGAKGMRGDLVETKRERGEDG